VCSFTVAVNRRKTQNNQNPETDYFNVSAWRQLGENCAKFLDKGRKVCVVGSVSVRTWDNGEKHGASLEVTADDVEFLSSRNESDPVDPQTGMKIVKPDELPY
jgi:single-strand DNA-binding protein